MKKKERVEQIVSGAVFFSSSLLVFLYLILQEIVTFLLIIILLAKTNKVDLHLLVLTATEKITTLHQHHTNAKHYGLQDFIVGDIHSQYIRGITRLPSNLRSK